MSGVPHLDPCFVAFVYIEGLAQLRIAYGEEEAAERVAFVAHALAANTRRGDRVIASGDGGFVVVLESVETEAEARACAHRIRETARAAPDRLRVEIECLTGEIASDAELIERLSTRVR